MKPISLFVVDDHTLFRRGLIALLSQDERLRVMGEAGDMGEALRGAGRYVPDLILLDNHLPGVRGVDGIRSTERCLSRCTRILMLTVSEDEADLAAAMRAGADGYLLKTVESDQLCDSIVKVMAGESVISPEMMTKFVAAFRKGRRYWILPLVTANRHATGGTTRRWSRFQRGSGKYWPLIARGDSNKLIARELDIAETTVKVHVQHIFRKLNLASRVQVAVYAAARGLG